MNLEVTDYNKCASLQKLIPTETEDQTKAPKLVLAHSAVVSYISRCEDTDMIQDDGLKIVTLNVEQTWKHFCQKSIAVEERGTSKELFPPSNHTITMPEICHCG